MAPADMTASPRPTRWGLAAKLFAILTLLGGRAVLITGVLGYLQARDALEESIYNQLTTSRKSKARQVETYFRTIRNELSQLATAKMTIDAAREFSAGFDELERSDVPFEVRRKVGDWYEADFLPEMRRMLGKEPNINDYLPHGPAAYYLQYHYIVANPYPKDRRKLVDDAGDGSAYSRQHAVYHPLLRGAATAFGFFDLMLADPKSGRLIYSVAKEVDFATSLRIGPYRSTNVCRRRRPLRRRARQVGGLLRGLRPLRALARRAHRLHGSAGDRPGPSDRRADRAIVDRGDRQCRNRRPALAAGRLRRHRRGLSRRARPIRALRPAGVLREPRPILRRAEARRRAGREHRCHPPLRHAGAAPARGDRGHPQRPCRCRGRGRDPRLSRHPDARLLGAAGDPRHQMGADRQDRHRRGVRTDLQAAERPDDRRRPGAAGHDADRRLAVALAAGAVARAHRRRDALCRRRLRRQGGGAHARRDRPRCARPSTAWSTSCAARMS